jgi:pimeloyl-ACP methyl ester carboxylesterase
MSKSVDVIWLNTSPSLQQLDRPLLEYLSKHVKIARWEYYQTKDEASYIYKAVVLLYDFLKYSDRPVHLAGHGISGVVGLMFARQYPKRVRSLTLLAVAPQPAATWHAHYYVQLQLLTLSREKVLANTVRSLFGKNPPYPTHRLAAALDIDLDASPTMHSLCKLENLPKGGVSMPLMVCGSKTDPIVHPPALHEWQTWLKPGDTLWECPSGYHFFHYFHPQAVGDQILSFWQRQHPQLLPEFALSSNT